MNFTQTRNVVKRTTLESLKGNSNTHYTVINKKTPFLFSFNPNTKIGILSAEITIPTINSQERANDQMPHVVIESKKENSFETTTVIDDTPILAIVCDMQEKTEANILKRINKSIDNVKLDIQTEVVSIVQNIPTYDDSYLKTEIEKNKQQHNALSQHITKLQKGNYESKKEFETIQRTLQQVRQEMLDKYTGLIEKHISKVVDRSEVEKIVKLQWDTVLSSTEEDDKSIFEVQLEKIVERIVKEEIEKDEVLSQNGSLSSHSVHYENIYEAEKDTEFCTADLDLDLDLGVGLGLGLEINPRLKQSINLLQKTIMDERENPNKHSGISDIYETTSCGGAFSYNTNALRNLTDKRWIPLGKGVSDTVMDMYVDPVTQKLYITGLFQCVDEVSAKNIASYDIKQKEWSNVGNGINNLGVCLCMDIENQILYVGGIFSQAGGIDSDSKVKSSDGITANNIVSYNLLTNEWESLGEGLNSECCVLCYDPTTKKLYAGGTFTKIGDKCISYIGVYNTVNKEWSALSDNELNGPCRAMVLDHEIQELYIGGIFNEVGEYIIYYVASVNLETGEWSELSGGLQGHCNCLCLHPNRKTLYVGGTFQSVGYIENRIDAHHVASFDLENREWSSMSGGVNGVCQSMIYSRHDNSLYVGGSFKKVISDNYYNDLKDAIIVNHIVKYDTINKEWKPLENLFDPKNEEENKLGLDGVCKSMVMDDKSIYIGGNFKEAGNVHANSIVRYLNVRMKK